MITISNIKKMTFLHRNASNHDDDNDNDGDAADDDANVDDKCRNGLFTVTDSPKHCPVDGKKTTNPTDCSKFDICDRGTLVTRACSKGTVFSQQLRTCIWGSCKSARSPPLRKSYGKTFKSDWTIKGRRRKMDDLNAPPAAGKAFIG